MMRSDELNRHDHGGYTEMNPPSLNVNVLDKDESKEIIVHGNLSENNSTEKSESERNIINKTLLQNNSAEIPQNTITKLKDEEHKEHSVTDGIKHLHSLLGSLSYYDPP